MKNRYNFNILLLLILLLGNSLVAQHSLVKPIRNAKTFIANLPPVQVRTMAEWEEVEALVIAWESEEEILFEIVRHAIKECKVFILTDAPSSIHTQFPAHGIFTPESDNVEFIPYSANTVWMRDYGPWSVYHNDVGTLAFSDFLYNRFHRLDDDLVPGELASYLGIPLYNADENPFQWVHTGGNFLRDGMGTAYSSDLILRENSGKTGLEVENFANRFFGINDYRILHRLPYDTIHHLDMHMRTLDEETLAIGWYPDGIADGPQIEANLDYIRQHFRTPFGHPYHIIRQQMPPSYSGQYPPQGHYRTYTNGIFINKTFLVPTYDEQYDSTALDIYREYLPGYNVVGINCNDIIPRLGALHCITKVVGVREPLRISHPRLRDTYNNQADYPVEAWVQHISGVDSVFLHYRLLGEALYDSIMMNQNSENLELWQANIPVQAAGDEVQYYISAYATDGKRQVRPLPAPEAYYPFRVKAYEHTPEAAWLQTIKIAAPDMDILFTNDSQNGVTELEWLFSGGEPAFSVDPNVRVRYPSPGTYSVQLIATNPLGKDTFLLENAVNIKTSYTPFVEDFENGMSVEWEAEGEINWETSNNSCHQTSIRVAHHLSEDDLNRTYLRTAFDLTSLASTALTFDVAHALRDSIYFDELRVNLIDEDGKTRNVYNKGGHILATIEELIPDFIPINCSQWRNETIDLREWEGQQVLLEFESIGDQGNNIYLDNIALRGDALPAATITHPADGTFYIGDGEPIFDTIQVSAIDPDGTIEKVRFYVNNDFLGDDFEAPYEYIYQIPVYEQYCYQARATDNEGLQVWAQQICVRYDESTASRILPEADINWQIHPNPVDEFLFLEVNSLKSFSEVSISILDVQGKLIKQQKIQLFKGDFQYPVSVKGLPKGNYFLHIQMSGFDMTKPFVKM